MKAKSHSRIHSHMLLPIAAALALGLSGCGGGGGGGTPTGSAGFSLTDAPVCAGIDSVVVTVTGVQVIGDSGTYTLTLPQPETITLTDYTNGATLPLGNITVPAGTYQQVRLILESNKGNGSTYANYVVVGGNEEPLMTPSAQQSGYKINGTFTVTDNGQANLTVDFNACRSVVETGNGTYILKPVLNLVDDDQSGSIAGYLPTTDADAVVMAEDNEGHVLKTTVVASDGSFTLAPLEASSEEGYNVVVAPPPVSSPLQPGMAPDVVLGVPVSNGQTTVLGSTTTPLPVIPLASTDEATYSGTITLDQNADALVVAQEPLGSNGPTISIAMTNGVEQSTNPPTDSYTMVLPTVAPNVASYAPGGSLAFSQSTTAPSITIQAYGSDGETGDIGVSTATSNASIGMHPGNDNTFEMDH